MSLTTGVIPQGKHCSELVPCGSKGRVKEVVCPYWGCTDSDGVCVGSCRYLGTDDLKLKGSDLFHKKKVCNVHIDGE